MEDCILLNTGSPLSKIIRKRIVVLALSGLIVLSGVVLPNENMKAAEASKTNVVGAAKIHPNSVSLNKSSVTLGVEETLKLTATVAPTNASNKNVTWKSSNPKVVTVNKGLIEGVSEGTAIITVTTTDGNKKATCTVTVIDDDIDIDGGGDDIRESVAGNTTGNISNEGTAALYGDWIYYF